MAAPWRLVLVGTALSGCVTHYHPDYHPSYSYSLEQNVVYAQKVVVEPPAPEGAPPIDVAMAAPYLNLWERTGKPGPSPPLPRRPETAGPHGRVSSPGGVVVYGDVYGDIFVGR